MLGSLWKRKWLLIVLTLVVFLSVGAVAWAAGSDDDQAASGDQKIADRAKGLHGGREDGTANAGCAEGKARAVGRAPESDASVGPRRR